MNGRSETKPSIGELVSLLSEKTSQLVKDEIRLAKAEMADKAKHAGAGIGMFVGAGLFAFFALATLIACAVLGLANAVPAWLAALIVAVVLLLIAGCSSRWARRCSTARPAPCRRPRASRRTWQP